MSNHREEEEEEEEPFHDSLDRLVSSSSCSCSASNSDYDSESSPRISSHDPEEPDGGGGPRRRHHPFPVPRFPMGASRFDLWISEPASVSERRSKLLTEMGLNREPVRSRLKPVSDSGSDISRSISCNQLVRRDHGDCSETVGGSASFVVRSKSDCSVSQCSDRDRLYHPPQGNSCSCFDSKLSHSEISITSCNVGTVSDPLRLEGSSDCVLVDEEVEVCTIKNLDNGKQFVVNEIQEEGSTWKQVKEVGTDTQMTMEEFEMSVGHSPIVQELMRRQNVEDSDNNNNASTKTTKDDEESKYNNNNNASKSKKKGSWFKSIKSVVTGHSKERRSSDDKDTSSERGGRRSSSATDDSQESSFHGPERVRVRQYGKSSKELTAMYKTQEIQAHNGSIWSIKFSLDGKYLASAGEDCVIHVWQVVEAEKRGELLLDRPELLLLASSNGSPKKQFLSSDISLSLSTKFENKNTHESDMSDARDVDDRVDFEEGSYSDMEDEVEEEQVEEFVEEEEEEEEEDDDDDEEEEEGGGSQEREVEDYGGERKGGDREELAEDDDDNHIDIETAEDDDDNHIDIETAEDEEKPASPIDEDEREKYSHLLSLPPHGSEVFIGGLPRDVGEEDLRDLCEAIGEIFEVRVMKDRDSGESKGYAFVGFRTKDVAQKAIEELHSKEFKGKTIRCSLSETKNRLFIGNIPKNWTEDEFRKVIEEVGPGVENIELIKDPTNSTRNRGFAFVLYYNNACADYSRQKMIDSNFKLEGNAPTVTWADPKSSPENSAAAAQVKALYVKNIPENTSTEQLKEIFQRHGEVTKIVTPPGKGGKRDFGFVHYAERSSALKAVKDSERYEINGQPLEVVLAKPQAERKHDSSYTYGAAPAPAPFALPTFGGFAAPAYGAMGSGLGIAGSFSQPMIYGRGSMPTGMQMVPMLLPDGRVGYVLQQPGMQMAPPPPQRPRRGDRNNGSSRGSGRENSDDHDGSRGGGRRYRPY